MKTILKIKKATRSGLRTISTLCFDGEKSRKLAEAAALAAQKAAKVGSSEIGGITCDIFSEK